MFYNLFIKRFIDIFCSSIAILLLSPLLIPIVIGLLFTGEHYVFYFQERIGYNNKKFHVYKFATMLKDSPNIGNGLHTTNNDSRILPIGHFLRKTKINELPQLFNIFLGSMSLVGPRPLVDKTFQLYSNKTKKIIYNTKPGLSGIGSIIFRNEEEILSVIKVPLQEFYKKNISPYKGALELWYLKNKSFYTDSVIIFITLWVVFFPKSNFVYKVFKDLPPKPDFLK